MSKVAAIIASIQSANFSTEEHLEFKTEYQNMLRASREADVRELESRLAHWDKLVEDVPTVQDAAIVQSKTDILMGAVSMRNGQVSKAARIRSVVTKIFVENKGTHYTNQVRNEVLKSVPEATNFDINYVLTRLEANSVVRKVGHGIWCSA